MIMTFGKHYGKRLEDIPESYLMWVLENCRNISPALRHGIERTFASNSVQTGNALALPIQKVVAPWHRQVAREFHPDQRGTHEAMIVVNRARDLLLEQIEGVA